MGSELSCLTNGMVVHRYFGVQHYCPRRGVKFGEGMYSVLNHLEPT